MKVEQQIETSAPAIETTTIWNKELRTYIPELWYFKTGADAFNALSPIPTDGPPSFINRDGTKVRIGIRDWNTDGALNSVTNVLKIHMAFQLSLSKEHDIPCEPIASAYNRPSSPPEKPVDLGDGRFIYISSWSTTCEGLGWFTPGELRGYIRFNLPSLKKKLAELYGEDYYEGFTFDQE